MRVQQIGVWLGVIMLAHAGPVWADPVTVVSTLRRVELRTIAGSDAMNLTQADQAFMSQSISATSGNDFATAGASLDTTNLTATDFHVLGDAFVNHNSSTAETTASATTSFRIVFDVNESLNYVFGATFGTTGNDELHRSIWGAELASHSTGTIFRYAGGENIGPINRGTLLPGRYSFSLSAASGLFGVIGGSGRTSATFNGGLGFEPAAATPEPASMLLLGTGLAMLARRAFKRAPSS